MDDNLIIKARDFAIKAHGDQMYGGVPYVVHLDDTRQHMAWILTYCPSFKFYSEKLALASAYLHDVLEDTQVTPNELTNEFGATMCYLIGAVTDEPGENRKERKAKTYPKILNAGPLAVALKLSDRMANTVACSKSKDPGLFNMYKKEWPDFYHSLYREGQGLLNMWLRLETIYYGLK